MLLVCGCNVVIWRKFQNGGIASQQQNQALQSRSTLDKNLAVRLDYCFAVLAYHHHNELSLSLRSFKISPVVYEFAVLLNFSISNSLLNPVAYVLRISEFKQTLGLCFRRKEAVMNMEGNEEKFLILLTF